MMDFQEGTEKHAATEWTDVAGWRVDHRLKAVGTENMVARQNPDALVVINVMVPAERTAVVVVSVHRVRWDRSPREERLL